MRYKLRVYSIMEFGQRVDAQGNPHQEDCLFPEFGTQSSADRLFVLCDGMGGHSAGEVASATVCEAMGHSALASMEGGDGLFTDDMLQRAIDDAFDALDAKDNGAEKKMGTTMTLLMLHDGGATVAHMGDSRVYQIRPGEDAAHTSILFETEDHSLVNDLIKVDLLTPEEARVSPQKNVITRAMQPHMEHRPKADVAHLTDIRPGDYFYMCTDGMLEQMDDTNIRFIFSDKGGDAQNKVGILTQATVENRDNHTAFVIEILDVEGEPVMTAEQSAPAAGAHCIMAEIEDGDDEAEEASDEVSADSDTDDTHGSDDAQQEPVTATIKNGMFRDQTLTVINRRHGNIFSDLLAALGGGKERQQLLQYIIIGVVVLLLGIIIIMGVRKLKFGPKPGARPGTEIRQDNSSGGSKPAASPAKPDGAASPARSDAAAQPQGTAQSAPAPAAQAQASSASVPADEAAPSAAAAVSSAATAAATAGTVSSAPSNRPPHGAASAGGRIRITHSQAQAQGSDDATGSDEHVVVSEESKRK